MKLEEQRVMSYEIIHLAPNAAKAFELTPKEKWKAQHRKERMARKGRQENYTLSVGSFMGVTFTESATSPPGRSGVGSSGPPRAR